MPQLDKEKVKEQLGNIESLLKNMPNPMDMGSNPNNMPMYGMPMGYGNNMMNPMVQQQMNIMMQNMMQTQRILQDIYITVHETHRAVLEIKYRLELE